MSHVPLIKVMVMCSGSHAYLWKEGTPSSHMNVSGRGEVPHIKIEVLLKEVEMNIKQVKNSLHLCLLHTLAQSCAHISIQMAPIHPWTTNGSNGTSLKKPFLTIPN